MSTKRVVVYCASSQGCHPDYHRDAYRLGEILADANITVVYGGGAVGSMGALADGALSRGGEVVGIIPHFMVELEWAHPNVTKLERVETMQHRKHLMLEKSDAAIALPGGSGTLEELFEALSLKRLGIYNRPILLVNTRGYFDECVKLLQHCVDERFMNARHAEMWTVVPSPDDVVDALENAPDWPDDAVRFAGVPEVGDPGSE